MLAGDQVDAGPDGRVLQGRGRVDGHGGVGARRPACRRRCHSARSWRFHGHCQGIGSGLPLGLGLGHGGLLDLGGVAAALGAGVLVERVGGRAPEATPDDAHRDQVVLTKVLTAPVSTRAPSRRRMQRKAIRSSWNRNSSLRSNRTPLTMRMKYLLMSPKAMLLGGVGHGRHERVDEGAGSRGCERRSVRPLHRLAGGVLELADDDVAWRCASGTRPRGSRRTARPR